ncbi:MULTISPECIES: MEDS domain-containing protein [unclassified Streptomyces]|uniref:MEDS domain-containing protein n=1 Tax=unclassified Streptomyces TaxID=2593676 RepID=UPI002E286DFF|nr:MEDS domain-containing protein [Streptomyces sp. NBC_00223]
MAGGTCGAPTPRTVAVERLTSGDHACLDFVSHRDRWALRAAFTTAGLARGERVMLFTDPATRSGEALTRLADFGVPTERAAADGRLEVLNSSPGYDPVHGFDAAARTGYWASVTDDALAHGFTGLRVAGDMVWACEPGVSGDALTSYESGLGGLFEKFPFLAMCEYDRRSFSPQLLERVLAVHPLSVLPQPGELRAERAGDALRLVGDADLATRTRFELSVREPGLARIDLTGLAFIDAYCVRTLLRLPGGPALECTRAQYRLLRLCGAPEAERTEVPVGWTERGSGADTGRVVLRVR